jgi:AbrB family looped-hinge helix DNA binding protein
MATATVSGEGWVVIPKEIREKHRIKPGQKVYFVDYGGIIALLPVPQDSSVLVWGC